MRRLEVIEEEGRTIYRYVTDRAPRRSDLPLPYVISDVMEPVEHVDGKFYTSKRAYRRVGREHGLTEVGNERLPPKQRSTNDPKVARERKQTIKNAIDKFRDGRRLRDDRRHGST